MNDMASIMHFLQGVFIDYESYFRILISATLGFVIGLDRTQKHKPEKVV